MLIESFLSDSGMMRSMARIQRTPKNMGEPSPLREQSGPVPVPRPPIQDQVSISPEAIEAARATHEAYKAEQSNKELNAAGGTARQAIDAYQFHSQDTSTAVQLPNLFA